MDHYNSLKRLFTKEDHLMTHKILGCFCLINFIYRYINFIVNGNMNFKSNLDLLSILPHLILSFSSLLFKISNNRHNSLPIIYPELRLHSILFASRSIICFYLAYHNYDIIYRMIICLLTNYIADLISHFLKRGTTVRDIKLYETISNKDEKELKKYYSNSQIGATLFMLGTHEMIFSTLFAIQIAPFTMTLVKKNIITSKMSHMIYSFSLWMNYIPILSSTTILIKIIIFKKICEVIRFDFNFSKYLMWPLIFSIYYLMRFLTLNNNHYLNYILISIAAFKKFLELYLIFKN